GWLGTQFDVRTAHLGRPPRSLTTLLVGGLLKLHRALRGSGAPAGTPDLLELLRLVCTARDRYHLFAKMRRFAVAGGIALCERYPVPQNRLLVGPEIGRLIGHGRDTILSRWLMRVEQWYYRRITRPDVIIVLVVDPELAVQRKTDEPADYVRARSRIIWETDWSDTGAHLVDASLRASPWNGTRLVVLDEGPLYTLTYLLVIGHAYFRRSPPGWWWSRTLRRWARSLDAVVILDAPDAVLAARIRERAKWHLMKDRSPSEVYAFATAYRDATDRVLVDLKAAGGPSVLRLAADDRAEPLDERLLVALGQVTHAH